jgi:ribosomal protein L22
MSAEEQPPEGTDRQSEGSLIGQQAKPAAKARPAAAKKPAAKKPVAEEAAVEKPAAKEPATKAVAGDESAAAEEKPAAKKPAARKPAAKKPAAKTASAPKAEKSDDTDVEKSSAAAESKPVVAKAEKADATKAEKPSAAKAGESSAAEEKSAAAKTGKSVVDAEKPAASARREAKPAAPTPPRRKVVRAQARYVRTSARKARMVCGHLRGKSVDEARAILAFTPREVARDWSKLLESAVANAENNHELIEDDLLIREAYADEGPTIKRFRPRAQGRATPIRKRTSHLTITLTPKP